MTHVGFLLVGIFLKPEQLLVSFTKGKEMVREDEIISLWESLRTLSNATPSPKK